MKTRGDQATVLRKSGSPSRSLATSPDGRWFVANWSDGRATVWDVTTSKVVHTIEGISLAGFSNDSQWLLGVDAQSILRRWSLATGKLAEGANVASPIKFTGIQGNIVAPFPGTNYPIGPVGPLGIIGLVPSEKGEPHILRVYDSVTGDEFRHWEIPAEREGTFWHSDVAVASLDQNFIAVMFWAGGTPDYRQMWQVYDVRTGRKVAEKYPAPPYRSNGDLARWQIARFQFSLWDDGDALSGE